MTTIRLAVSGSFAGKRRALLEKALGKDAKDVLLPRTPAILVSYYYIQGFEDGYHRTLKYRDWILDSGAFSAYNSGETIDLNKYTDYCLKKFETDPTLKEVIALDVIGDGEGSLENLRKMLDQGVNAIPVFHIGEDWEILKEYCRLCPKVGLSCRFGESVKKSYWFYEQCFARAWPKKFHSFGWIDDKMLKRFPFHSADSATWLVGPCAFGGWKTFGKLSIFGSDQNLIPQVRWFLDLEIALEQLWQREMKLLANL